MNTEELRALIREVLHEVLAEEKPVHRVERGAVTERHVAAAASAGATLVLGAGAVLTPLARDRIRATGITVEREAKP
ncbi:hypothetical protein ACIBG8_11600 [Nonomuraea sp. NPDC050556]|uniref:hypothetical protein n=1 Tax=Nonomuraea sp. NPDC050556 TaxID=3364369 RepID=UPI003788E432